jgi:chemotaxis protein CheD
MTEHRVPVPIGEVRVAGPGAVLYCIGIGSCIAIVLHDAEARIGGLAHAMLPDPSAGRRRTPAGRFAATAVSVLLDEMVAAGADARRVRARLAGGASMFEALLTESGRRLGVRNAEAARKALEDAGVPLLGEEVGGTWGRSVFLDTCSGFLTITSVARPDVIL